MSAKAKIRFGETLRRRFPRSFLFYGVLLILVLAIAGSARFLLYYKPHPKEAKLSGSAAQIGLAYGKMFRTRMRVLTRVYLEGIVCQKNRNLVFSRQGQALKSLEQWPAAYREELHAVSQASGLELGALAYANSFLDIGQARAGCRSVVISSTNRLFHAHNLDWDNLGGLGRWAVCIVRRRPTDGRMATVAITFPGLIGALDIINEKGLALSFNQLGVGRTIPKEPVFIMMRRIAEHCASLDEARSEILAAAPGMPFIITVSDAGSGTAAVFERSKDKISERPLHQGWVAACNVSQGTNTAMTSLDLLLKADPVSNAEQLQAVLSNPKVLLMCNIYSVIFDFRGNKLHLASGAIPAALEKDRTYPLFER